jgi:hypothetical protein
MATKFLIESRTPRHPQWSRDGLGLAENEREWDSEQSANDAIDSLKTIDEHWASYDYRVVRAER